MFAVPLPHRAVKPVRADHEVGVRVHRRVGHLGADLDAHSQLLAAPSQHAEQCLARQAAEAVAARGDNESAIVDIDVVPVGEVARHRVVGLGIGRGQIILRRVGEHDAKPEGVLEPIALEDRDLVPGICFFHQDPEVQRRGSAADRDDSHLTSCPAMMRC